MYDITRNYITKNRPGTALNAEGAVCHSTATPGATDENEREYFNREYLKASAHTFIDWDSITEVIPWNEVALHAGPTANRKLIGVELCEPREDDTDSFRKFTEVWNRAVWYFADMFVKKGWSIDKLHSHSWVSATYGETDHTDPYEYFTKYGKTFAEFNDAVAAEMAAIKGGSDIVEVSVVYFSSDDYSIAKLHAAKYGNCGMYCRDRQPGVHPDALKAKKVVNIGGPALNVPGEEYLSGQDAKETAKKAVAAL